MEVLTNALWWLFAIELAIAGALVAGAASVVFFAARWLGKVVFK